MERSGLVMAGCLQAIPDMGRREVDFGDYRNDAQFLLRFQPSIRSVRAAKSIPEPAKVKEKVWPLPPTGLWIYTTCTDRHSRTMKAI